MKDISILRIRQFREGAEPATFYVNTLREHLISHHSRIEQPHKHDFFAFVFFTQGQGLHNIDFRDYEVRPGSIFMLAPGQVHSWNLSADTEGFIFFHSMQYYAADELNLPFLQLKEEEMDDFKALLIRLLEESDRERPKRDQYINHLIHLIYIEIERHQEDLGTGRGDSDGYQSRFRAFERLLETHFKEIKSPSVYADKLYISAKHLHRITTTVVGKPPSELILERVILEAKRMLTYTSQNLNEVARMLGYEDYSYFSHLFKKRTGFAPSHFLKEQ